MDGIAYAYRDDYRHRGTQQARAGRDCGDTYTDPAGVRHAA